MRRRLRACAAAALLPVAALLTGCGDQEGIRAGGTVIGETLTVYSILPHPEDGVGRDLVDGQKLALADAGGRAGRYGVNYVSLDTSGGGREEDAAAAAAATRQALADAQVAAVIGPLESDSARIAVPLLNAAGILAIAPGAGDPGLACPAGPGEPGRYQPAGAPTLVRTVGDDRALSAAMVRAAAPGGDPAGLRVAVEEAPGEGTERIADALREAARAAGARVLPDAEDAEAVLWAGVNPRKAARGAERLAGRAPGARIVLGDPVVREGVAARLEGAARRRAVLVSRAPAARSTPALREFARRFRAAFRRAPGPYAALGYQAMEVALATIARAGAGAGHRQTLVDTALGARGIPTLLGPAGFDRRGLPREAAFSAGAPGERAERIALGQPPCGEPG